MSGLLLLIAALQGPAVLDEGTFIIRRDTSEIAREDFSLVTGRAGGWSVRAVARYDRARPATTLAPLLDLAPDSTPLTLQYEVADPHGPLRILGQAGRSRFTLRYLARSSESARELPTGPNPVILDDSVFALFLVVAWQARPQPATVSAIYPRGARRETLTLEDHGLQPTTVNHDPATLRHLTLTGGVCSMVHLWLDRAGRLMKIEQPERHLVVERRPAI